MRPMRWRAFFKRLSILERRWIRKPAEREAHNTVVRERLGFDASDRSGEPSDPLAAEREASDHQP
jgi:hypothetical protein